MFIKCNDEVEEIASVITLDKQYSLLSHIICKRLYVTKKKKLEQYGT